MDVVVAGGGVIGLSLALELRGRGASVTVLESGRALRQASSAAAGMLAVDDPHNPPALHELARYSATLYPEFLARLEALGGVPVPFQTDVTWQYSADHRCVRLAERSLDPKQLAEALLAAALAAGVELQEQTAVVKAEARSGGVEVLTFDGQRFEADHMVYTNGAWAGGLAMLQTVVPISPRKGQMLRVRPTTAIREVHRSEQIYAVPRIYGPQAGTVLVGATVEDAGFDTQTHAEDLAGLRALAAELVPELAQAEQVEAWAGLRPATADGLPMLARLATPGVYVASGHFRNGILLAPGTASAMADMIEGRPPAVGLGPFGLERFHAAPVA